MVTDLSYAKRTYLSPLPATSILFDHTELFELSLTILKIHAVLLYRVGPCRASLSELDAP